MKKPLCLYALLLLLLIVPSVSAQSLLVGYKNNSDTRFQDLSIPDKWKSEQAVVLNNVVSYDYDIIHLIDGSKLSYSKQGRRQVKLLSRAAIDVFSRFYFSARDSVIFTVVKPDGRRLPVSQADQMDVNSTTRSGEVPSFFRSGSQNRNASYKKLAIPGLQPGDVLDYYYFETEMINYKESDKPVPSVFEELQLSYPIKNTQILIAYDPLLVPSISTGNGAPELSREAGKISLQVQNREGQVQERWTSDNQISPYLYLRFITDKNTGEQSKVDFAWSEQGGPNGGKKMSRDEIFRYRACQLAASQEFPYHQIPKRIKKAANAHCKGSKDKYGCYAQHAFQYVQHSFFRIKTYHGASLTYNTPEIMLLDQEALPMDDVFLKILIYTLRKKKVPFEIIAAVPPIFGTLDRVPALDNLEWGVRIKGDQPVDIFEPGNYTAYGAIPSWLYGCELLVASGDSPLDIAGPVTHETIAAPAATANVMEEQVTVNVRPEMDSLEVDRTTFTTGVQKARYANGIVTSADLADINDFYRQADKSGKNLNKPYYYALSAKLRYIAQYRERQEPEERQRYLRSSMGSEFDDFSYGTFEMVQSGVNEVTPLTWRETFTMGSRLKRGGENFVFEIGHFLGSQVEIQDDERDRKYDIFMDYPRQFVKKVRVAIPSGYTVEGLENLNFDVQNETGGFVSTARVEGQEIVFNSTKTYTHKFEPKENWPLMVAFLDAAKACSRGKILFRKKG